jgi:hypothetical protein
VTSGSKFFQNTICDFLQLAETCEVLLKVVIERLRVLRAKLRAQDHVAEFHGMRQQCVFLQFFERGPGIVVIHEFPRRKNSGKFIVLARPSGSERQATYVLGQFGKEDPQWQGVVSEWPVIRPGSMPSAEITFYKPTYQDLSRFYNSD